MTTERLGEEVSLCHLRHAILAQLHSFTPMSNSYLARRHTISLWQGRYKDESFLGRNARIS